MPSPCSSRRALRAIGRGVVSDPLPLRKGTSFLPGSDGPFASVRTNLETASLLTTEISLELDPKCGILTSQPWFGSCKGGHFGFGREERKIFLDSEAPGRPCGGTDSSKDMKNISCLQLLAKHWHG